MPFIGNQPALSYTSFAKQDFTTSATTSYTLSQPVTNENEIALFINFVRQEPTTAYTASGTSLTLTSATSASDDMYAIFLGKAVQTVNPPAGSVGASQIADGSIALGKLSATGTKDSTTFLRGDNSFAEVPAGGITEADVFRVSSSFTGDASPITSNWERADDASSGLIGTGMTQSSGVFTFPSTGIYFVRHTHNLYHSGDDRNIEANIYVSTDGGSSWDSVATGLTMVKNITGGLNSGCSCTAESLIDVTSTANVKVQFAVFKQNASTTSYGDTNTNRVYSTFIRLGDT